MKKVLTLCRTIALSDTEVTGMQSRIGKQPRNCLIGRDYQHPSFPFDCRNPQEGENSETLVLAQDSSTTSVSLLCIMKKECAEKMLPRQVVKAEWGLYFERNSPP